MGRKKKRILKPKPTIEELEALLDSEEEQDIEILPNGEIRATSGGKRRKVKPITLRENLGGEYSVAA